MARRAGFFHCFLTFFSGSFVSGILAGSFECSGVFGGPRGASGPGSDISWGFVARVKKESTLVCRNDRSPAAGR